MSNTVSELLINHERLLTYDQQIRQASRNLKQRNQQLSPLREQVESLYDELTFSEQTRPVYPGNGSSNLADTLTSDFDALQFDRYTAVHSLLQRFQELMVQVQEIQEDIDVVERELQETLIEVRQSLDKLDGDLTESRLVAFGMLAKSFIQPLEQLSDRHGKPVQIRIEGENVLVELAILEQLRTPLTHLLRNAFDHGLEPPQERQHQGKPPQGTLTLGASLTHNQVMIRVADDGRGVNLEKVRQRAVALGLLTAEESQSVGQEALLDYLFAPGFSTATQVSDLSGRGLGLDIVKQLVEGLRGRLHLETQPGEGSCFVIQIPLTLNILPLLLVRSQQRLIAFPSQSILRAISLKEDTHNHQVKWQDQWYPVRSLAELLPYDANLGGRLPPGNQEVGLMVNLKDQVGVLAVDQIVDERPLVVKALDAITPLPPYLIGCTVLGTGEVIPIFAPENFERLWQQLSAPLSAQERAKLTHPEPSSGDKTTILVIDDSITVRRTLERILSRSGYGVIQCRDGKEAWELLGRHREPISLAFCDLEMPNMDGYSLLQLIRGDQQWRSLPVVVLTSRENATHRQRAMDLGANHYLTKPFQPNQLLALVASLAESAS